MRYVIIGNSTAAIAGIEGIRSKDKQGCITLISMENHHTYSKPLISYLMQGKTNIDRMKYRPDSFYKDNDVHAIFAKKAVKIDPDIKSVFLDDSTAIEYDKLLVATGSSPFIPDILGLDKVNDMHTFMTLDDAKSLLDCVTSQSRILILGAGLIGLKCCEGIKDKVSFVTVIDMAKQVLPSILDKESSDIVTDYLLKQGVNIKLSCSVKQAYENSALLTDETTIEFDTLVIAVGVRPNISILKAAKADTDRGVLIDEHCKTSIEDIYAAGDCTQGYDMTVNNKRVLALLANAYMQGFTAGVNMAGNEASFNTGMPMNALSLMGMHILSAGVYEGEDYVEKNEAKYKRLFYSEDKLKGFILVDDIECAGIYTAMIRNKTPLSSVDFDLIKRKPSLCALAIEKRSNLLNGKETW
jgi:NAD(P)H-nitrite reductase large subunit